MTTRLCALSSQRFVMKEHEQWLRCFGYVGSLVVKALLLSRDFVRFTKDLEDAGDVHAFKISRSQGE